MNNKEKNFISVVVYVRNNEKDVANFIKNIKNVLENNFLKYEIIFVNDGSIDNTVKVIKQEIKENDSGNVTILNMSYYQGKELAMSAGLDLSIGDFVYQFENIEMNYSLDLIMDIYRKSLEGFDIVTASPSSGNNLFSKIFYYLFNKYSNIQNKLHTITFEIISRRAINRVNQMDKSITYRKAVEANCGLKIATIEYDITKKDINKHDKYVRKERKKNAIDSLILFTDLSYKFSITLTFVMIFFTIAMFVYAITFFILNKPIEGWTTTILFLSFCFSGIFMLYAIVMKYLSLIINLIFKKSNYLVDSIEKIN